VIQKFTIATPIVLILAAAIASADAQEEASIKPLLHQSGCIDFSAEYEGCLSFGPRPEEEKRVLRDDAGQLHAHVSIRSNTSSREPLLATTSSAISDHDGP
jgi:hypothetical protein